MAEIRYEVRTHYPHTKLYSLSFVTSIGTNQFTVAKEGKALHPTRMSGNDQTQISISDKLGGWTGQALTQTPTRNPLQSAFIY